jgi:hypothetical protein
MRDIAGSDMVEVVGLGALSCHGCIVWGEMPSFAGIESGLVHLGSLEKLDLIHASLSCPSPPTWWAKRPEPQ